MQLFSKVFYLLLYVSPALSFLSSNAVVSRQKNIKLNAGITNEDILSNVASIDLIKTSSEASNFLTSTDWLGFLNNLITRFESSGFVDYFMNSNTIYPYLLLFSGVYAYDRLQSKRLFKEELINEYKTLDTAKSEADIINNDYKLEKLSLTQAIASLEQRIQVTTSVYSNAQKEYNNEPLRQADQMASVQNDIDLLTNRRNQLEITSQKLIDAMSATTLQFDSTQLKLKDLKKSRNIITEKLQKFILDEELGKQGIVNLITYNSIPSMLEFLMKDYNNDDTIADLIIKRGKATKNDLNSLTTLLEKIESELTSMENELSSVNNVYKESQPSLETYETYVNDLKNKIDNIRIQFSEVESKRAYLLDALDKRDLNKLTTKDDQDLQYNKALKSLQAANEELKNRILTSDDRLMEIQITMQKRLDEAKALAKHLNIQLKKI